MSRMSKFCFIASLTLLVLIVPITISTIDNSNDLSKVYSFEQAQNRKEINTTPDTPHKNLPSIDTKNFPTKTTEARSGLPSDNSETSYIANDSATRSDASSESIDTIYQQEDTQKIKELERQRTELISSKVESIFHQKSESEQVPIILQLDNGLLPDIKKALTSSALQNMTRSIQDKVSRKLAEQNSNYQHKNFNKFTTIPFMVVNVSKEEALAFTNIAEITNIQEDELSAPLMAQSGGIIGADTARSSGFTGNSQYVAVLDTGVDKFHPFLSGSVVSEACYSKAAGYGSGTSLCPGGMTSSTASGSGVNCNPSVTGCGHGTHVAGTITGNNGSLYGVAPDTGIIAINVFTNINGKALSYTSDQIKGLERVYELRNTYKIAAINMSLGGGSYASYCDSDSRKAIIDYLKSAGIATIIASGNNGYSNSVSAPSCISSAITVGSTDDGSSGSLVDSVSSFSNSASMIDMLAPGKWITSSVPGGGYAAWQGTSMATPHVAGAFAVLKAIAENASVSEIESALETTGQSIADSKNGITKPRIKLFDAITSLANGPITITLTPSEAVSAGAQWRVNGGDWQNSGDTVNNAYNGQLIEYKLADHASSDSLWVTPPPNKVSLVNGAMSTNTAYIANTKPTQSSDFDGDGRSDIFLNNLSDGKLHIYLMDGLTRLDNDYVKRSDSSTINLAPSWIIPGINDMNGDGKADVLLRNKTSGRLHVYLMDGLTRIGNDYIRRNDGSIISLGASWRVAGVSDMDGDGKSDILLRNLDDGKLHIYLMDGLTRKSNDYVRRSDTSIISLTPSWVVVGVNDMDGDGKSDIVLRNLKDGITALLFKAH